MNDSPGGNHWLELALQGTKQSRRDWGKSGVLTRGQTQFNHVTTATGYASSSAGPLHFGLGAAKKVDEVQIRWPSGKVQVLKDVLGDQILRIKEPN